MDYVILENIHDRCELEGQVQEYLKHGWRPQGGVHVTFVPANDDHSWNADGSFMLYSQAMVHEIDGAFQPGVDGPDYQPPSQHS